MKAKKTATKPKKKSPKMLSKKEWLSQFFGKVKSFGDGVEYQRKLRDA